MKTPLFLKTVLRTVPNLLRGVTVSDFTSVFFFTGCCTPKNRNPPFQHFLCWYHKLTLLSGCIHHKLDSTNSINSKTLQTEII